jgi:hypothetical protein
VSPDRRTYRHRDGQILIVLGLWAIVFPFCLGVYWPEEALTALIIFGPLGPFLYLFGLAAAVTVTPQQVIVSNIFLRRRIARSLLVPPVPDGTFLQLANDKLVDVTAFSTAINKQTKGEAIRWLRSTLDEIRPQHDDGHHDLRPRLFHIAIAVAVPVVWLYGYHRY